MLSTFANWRLRRETVRELSRLSDRQLADIGIERDAIHVAARVAPEMTGDEIGALVRPRAKLARLGADPIFDEPFRGSALPSRA